MLHSVGFEADAIAFDGFVEAFGRDQHRAFQQPPILHLFEPLNIFADGERKLEKKRGKP